MTTHSTATSIDLAALQRYDHRGALMVPDSTGDYLLVPDVREALARRTTDKAACSPNCFWGDCPPCVEAGVAPPQAGTGDADERTIPKRWQDRLPKGASLSYDYAHVSAMKREIEEWRALSQHPKEGADARFLANLARSRSKYPGIARMFDGLMGEVDELRRAYVGDGDRTAEAFDVAVVAYRIATEGDDGGNSALAQQAAAAPALIQALEQGNDRESAAWFDIHPSSIEEYEAEGYRIRKLYDSAAPARADEAGDAKDSTRLDWLNQNFFSDQKDEWDERLAPDSIKWKFFGPMSIQGDIRRVIDAAIDRAALAAPTEQTGGAS